MQRRVRNSEINRRRTRPLRTERMSQGSGIHQRHLQVFQVMQTYIKRWLKTNKEKTTSNIPVVNKLLIVYLKLNIPNAVKIFCLEKRRKTIRQAAERQQQYAEMARHSALERFRGGSSDQQFIPRMRDCQGLSSRAMAVTVPESSEGFAIRGKWKEQLAWKACDKREDKNSSRIRAARRASFRIATSAARDRETEWNSATRRERYFQRAHDRLQLQQFNRL